jgi:hypothetical protein
MGGGVAVHLFEQPRQRIDEGKARGPDNPPHRQHRAAQERPRRRPSVRLATGIRKAISPDKSLGPGGRLYYPRTALDAWLHGLLPQRSTDLVWRWDDPRVSNVQSDLILEMTVGGWDNNAVDDKQLPVDYVIDYVRV